MLPVEPIPAPLSEVIRRVNKALHCPDNLGMEFRTLQLPMGPHTPLLAVFAIGLADEDLVQTRVIEPLQRPPVAGIRAGTDPTPVTALNALLPAAQLRTVGDLNAAVDGILNGETALFSDGSAEAVLIETVRPIRNDAGSIVAESPLKDVFGRRLIGNIALLRERLRDPALVARPLGIRPARAGGAALVYLEGRAAPDLVERVRTFAREQLGEQRLRRGMAAGVGGKWGLLPRLLTVGWPDRAAALLDAGHVAVLVDDVNMAYIGPVTAPAMLYGPLDSTLIRPIVGLLRFVRLLTALFVLLSAGAVVALLNYHQEMMPTPFLLAMAAVREQSPFPIVVEVLLLELLQEVIREAGFHLPARIAPGSALIAGKLLLLLMAQAGVVGTLPAVVSITIAFITVGLINYEGIYLVRAWRFVALAGGAIFGFFGLTVVLFMFAAYLTRAESFGVPFIGESGLKFSEPGRRSTRRLGGKPHAKSAAIR